MVSDATAAVAATVIKESTAMAVATEEVKKEMVTPKSENSILKQPTLCPPAPRKLQPVCRKALAELSQNKFYCVKRDLSSVFVKLPIAGPPKKRIRLL